MANSHPSLFVAVAKQTAIIRITGRANFAGSIDFKTVVHELMARGFNCFILELTDCITMDSTFLGVLAGLALKLEQQDPNTPKPTLQLYNPNNRIVDLLENLGVSHLFTTTHGTVEPPKNCAPIHLDLPEPTKAELSRNCLEAHQLLMQINPDNVPKFKEVTRFLAEDLKNMEGGQP